MGEQNRAVGTPLPLWARRLVLLDRALREAEEPGVLEMTPAALAHLEARLFAATGPAAETESSVESSAERPVDAPEAGQQPALKLIRGGRYAEPAESHTARATSEAKRRPAARLRLLRAATQ